MGGEKSSETCFWRSRDGYCTEGGKAPEKCKEVCNKYTPTCCTNNK